MPSLRPLLKSRAYTAIALLTLALGIGVNTSLVSIVNSLILRRFAFPEAERLVGIQASILGIETATFSPPEIREIEGATDAFSDTAILWPRNVTGGNTAKPSTNLVVMLASHEIFAVLGQQPLLGRTFTEEETRRGNNNVVLLSYAHWLSQYNGDPSAIGQILQIEGIPVTIIGVVPPTFENLPVWGGQAGPTADLWRPLAFDEEDELARGNRFFGLIGRLKDGMTAEHAAVQLNVLAERQSTEHPRLYRSIHYRVTPLSRTLLSDTSTKIIWTLFGLAVSVLLIVCFNLATLQLTRITGEYHSLAIRCALGASPKHLAIQQFFESFVLSITGGLLGLMLAVVCNRYAERSLGAEHSIPLDQSLILASLGIAAVTSIAFGALPAWFVSRVNIGAALKSEVRGSSDSSHSVRKLLIICEIAAALVLLSGAATMQRGFRGFLQHDPGWDPENVLVATLPIPRTRYNTPESIIAHLKNVETQVSQLPGVQKAAIASSLPLTDYTVPAPVATDDHPNLATTLEVQASLVMVSSDYFSAMGIKLIEGHSFPPDTKRGDPSLAIINESLARHLWPEQSAVGKRIVSIQGAWNNWSEIIGVAQDVDSATDLGDSTIGFEVYRHVVTQPWPWVYLVVRSENPAALTEMVRKTINDVDPMLPPFDVVASRDFIRNAHRNITFITRALTVFASLAVLLAALGIYGVIARLVTQQTLEFGIRMALGASPKNILFLVLKHGAVLAAIGSVIGLGGAYALDRVLQAFIPRVAGPDPLTLFATTCALFAITMLSCWIPARRATKVDPLVAMRSE